MAVRPLPSIPGLTYPNVIAINPQITRLSSLPLLTARDSRRWKTFSGSYLFSLLAWVSAAFWPFLTQLQLALLHPPSPPRKFSV
ncbi:hypothetical protein AAHA92_24785 [Salvia divinorum]|uniref:Uncharacterized protein n=1 Tax=Salvia divinorum TaxID=28513 RepID=A0ABD1G8I9_SALDI